MNRNLTSAEIETLFAFVKRKGVTYYDLQVELVDHLASEIEQQWLQYPSLPLEQALEKVYTRFGIFGFTEVVEKTQAALARRGRKLWWNYFKLFWKLPRIVFTLALIGFIWACCVRFGISNVILANLILSCGWIIYKIYHLFKHQPKISLTPRVLYGGNPISFIQSPIMLQYFYYFSEEVTLPEPVIVIAFGLAWISSWASHETDLHFLKEQQRLYPQAFA